MEVFADSEEAMTVVKKYLQSSDDLTLYIDVLNDDADELSYDVEEDCWSVTFCDTNGPEDINLNELIAKDIIKTCMPKPHLKVSVPPVIQFSIKAKRLYTFYFIYLLFSFTGRSNY